MAAKLVRLLQDPVQFGGNTVRTGCSIGNAVHGPSPDATSSLLSDADHALYETKRNGRGRFECFSEKLKNANLNLRAMGEELRRAVEEGQFAPVFQPQFDAKTLRIVGAEALAGWHHPIRRELPPSHFLPIAEALNLVSDIDAAILDGALFESGRWQFAGLSVDRVSVNISAQRLKDRRLFEKLEAIDFAPGSLPHELLESISFEEQDLELHAAIDKLKAAKIHIEIDDFGTAHASIMSLIDLSPKRFKIDRRLVSPNVTSPSQRQLVSSIIDIGKSLNIEIVAEGVETLRHVELLRAMGCDILQGFALARPMSASEFCDFVIAHKPGLVCARTA